MTSTMANESAAGTYILLLGLKPQSHEIALTHFTALGHRVASAQSAEDSAQVLEDPALDLVYLQSPTLATELARLAEIRPALPVVAILNDSTVPGVMSAWHAGAADVLILPFGKEQLEFSLGRVLKKPVQKTETGVEARLRYLDENGKEHWVPVFPPRFTIGRSSNNDLVLTMMNISRSQAEILISNGEYRIRDLESKHGTFLNGVRVEEPAALNHGDRIQLGGLHGHKMTFYQGDLLQSLLKSSDSMPDMGLSVRGFREIGMLLATFRALSSIPLLDDLLALVVDTAIELTGAERGFIMLKDEDDELQFRCARNSYKRPLDGSSFQTSRRVPDEVFRTSKPAVINDLDVGDDSEDHATTRRLGVRSIFCVPLRYLALHDTGNLSGIGRFETIGVLYVDSQSIGAQLSGTQIEALETLASEAAMAIYNARLYKESQEKRRLDEELAIAREIQQALLPASSKVLPFVFACSHNIPCHEVGGDYFDYFDLDGDRLGFALGDVAGKGMSAALWTSMLQGIFSAQTLFNLPPAEVLTNVNRNLVRRGTGNRFVTFFFGTLESNGTCVYTNAGHNPPILLSRDGTTRELTEGGMVLGLFGNAQYESGTVQLQPGEHLVLFTDGVLEARNKKGEEFGEDRLAALLQDHARDSASTILSSIEQAIAEFSAGTPQHDDITMMVLGYQETESSASFEPQAAGSIA